MTNYYGIIVYLLSRKWLIKETKMFNFNLKKKNSEIKMKNLKKKKPKTEYKKSIHLFSPLLNIGLGHSFIKQISSIEKT